MRPVYLNGKFIAQRTTGVQRVARHLIHALDGQIGGSEQTFVLLCPMGFEPPVLRQIAVRHAGIRGLPLHLWEQFVLPFAARGGILVNLAGAAPWFGRRQLCLLHDAAVFDHPRAYGRLFVTWYRLLFRRLARHAEKLLTVSEFSRERLELNLDLAAKRIAVLHNGADHWRSIQADDSILERHGLTGKRFLLAVGSTNSTKNLPALIDAWSRLRLPKAQCALVIVGSGNDRVFAADATTPGPGVVHTGGISDASLKSLYCHALAMVFPSIYEGFGLPPLEAMSCGCAVAAAKAASIPEVCGDAALYFNPHSIDSIIEALTRLLCDDALRQRLSAGGPAHAARFLWADAAKRLQAEIDALNMTPAPG